MENLDFGTFIEGCDFQHNFDEILTQNLKLNLIPWNEILTNIKTWKMIIGFEFLPMFILREIYLLYKSKKVCVL